MDQIFIGSGVEKFEGNLVECSICLSDIPNEWIFEYLGKKYLKIKVQRKKEVDKYGKSHSVSINTFKPEAKTNVQKYAESQKSALQSPEFVADTTNDLPF